MNSLVFVLDKAKINYLIRQTQRISQSRGDFTMYWLPRQHSSKEFAFQCRRFKRRRLDAWVGKIHWNRKQPILVFLPGKFYGQRSLAGHSSLGRKELDATENATEHAHAHNTQYVYVISFNFFQHIFIEFQLCAVEIQCTRGLDNS